MVAEGHLTEEATQVLEEVIEEAIEEVKEEVIDEAIDEDLLLAHGVAVDAEDLTQVQEEAEETVT